VRSLLHVVAGRSQAGVALPEILPSLTRATIAVRKGQLHIVTGLPGRGKTLFALWYAINSGVKTLYFSFDSDEGTVSNRSAAILMDRQVSEVAAMREGPEVVEVEDVLSDLQQRIRFDFSAAPTMDDVYEETQAWVEMFGDTPELIVVDNLLNLRGGSDAEFTAMRDNIAGLHGLARETGSAVMVLHHVNASLLTSQSTRTRIYEDRPAHFGALMGQVSQLPESIYSVCLSGNQFKIAAVKNRDGLADPSANSYLTVACDPSRMSLYDSVRDMETARTRREWT
jgi:KaiC/GvpD/RAD55 family RecA-like ATPase